MDSIIFILVLQGSGGLFLIPSLEREHTDV
jgi:hypothetical protein